MKMRIQFEAKQLQKELERFADVADKDVGEVVEQRAGHVARDLAYTSQPWGLNGATKKKLEGSVKKDISKVYALPSQIFDELKVIDIKLAKAFSSLVRRGDFVGAERILSGTSVKSRNVPVESWDGGYSHSKSRSNRDGRVRRHRAAKVLMRVQQFRAYVKQRQANVGFTKAGWLAAAMRANLPLPKSAALRVPQWVKRHASTAPGRGQNRTYNTLKPFVELVSAVPWASRKQGQGSIAKALLDVRMRLREEIKRVINYQADKLNQS